MLPVLSMLITLLGDGVVASSTAVELLAADALGQRRLAVTMALHLASSVKGATLCDLLTCGRD